MLGAGVHPKIASAVLGHSSVAFTMDVYTDAIDTMVDEAAVALGKALDV
jgi:integrase